MSAIKLQLPRSGLLEQMSAHYSQPLLRLGKCDSNVRTKKNKMKLIGWTFISAGFIWLTYFSLIPIYQLKRVEKLASYKVRYTKPVDPKIVNDLMDVTNEGITEAYASRIIVLSPACLMLAGAFLVSYQKKKERGLKS